MTTATITYDHETGEAVFRSDYGQEMREKIDRPINSGTDSHAIANLFGKFDTVEHDGEFIHVTLK